MKKQYILLVVGDIGKHPGAMYLELKPNIEIINIHHSDYDSVRGMSFVSVIFDSTVDNDKKPMFMALVRSDA